MEVTGEIIQKILQWSIYFALGFFVLIIATAIGFLPDDPLLIWLEQNAGLIQSVLSWIGLLVDIQLVQRFINFLLLAVPVVYVIRLLLAFTRIG